MEPILIEWLNLVARWIHVMAAILWIGDSFLFMWMDRSLTPPSRSRHGAVVGELWMVHSGGFYEVIKRRSLARDELPASLHWFKWQAYTTWLSGLFLLVVVYYLQRGVYLVDADSPLAPAAAVALSVGLLGVAWLAYDGLWRSPVGRSPALASTISFALLAATAYGLTQVFSARASFLQLGAMLGTIMTANVWRVIMPAQRAMLAATRAGEPVDVTPGARAKVRSVHNHYLTFPVLFTMLSPHFPSTYGHRLNWLVLILLVAVGAIAKYVMNERGRSNRWLAAAGVASLAAVVTLTLRGATPSTATGSLKSASLVPFAEASAIVERRCVACHAAHPANPAFPQPPLGVTLDQPAEIRRWSQRILARAVITKTMPLGNLTGMTDDERRALGAWVVQGSRITDGPVGPASR